MWVNLFSALVLFLSTFKFFFIMMPFPTVAWVLILEFWSEKVGSRQNNTIDCTRYNQVSTILSNFFITKTLFSLYNQSSIRQFDTLGTVRFKSHIFFFVTEVLFSFCNQFTSWYTCCTCFLNMENQRLGVSFVTLGLAFMCVWLYLLFSSFRMIRL